MINEICGSIHNYFERDFHNGTFQISSGEIALPFLKNGQYFRIVGSVFNDGVHQYGNAVLQDETFEGIIVSMNIPQDFLNLVAEIEEWQSKFGTADGVFQSESFGGYSYQKAINANGSSKTWKDAFRGRLSQWRKL